MTKTKNPDSPAQMIKLGLILALYAVISCTVLAFVNYATKPKIEQNQINKTNAAMKSVMQDAEFFEEIKDFSPSALSNSAISISALYAAKSQDKVIGGVAQVSGPTYDSATIILGLKTDGTISGLRFLELSDTPGFGLKANDPTFILPSGKTFYDQFEGKKFNKGLVLGQTVDAISGATITSKGVVDLVNVAGEALTEYFGEHNYE